VAADGRRFDVTGSEHGAAGWSQAPASVDGALLHAARNSVGDGPRTLVDGGRAHPAPRPVSPGSRRAVRISDGAEDPRWDAFLERSGAHHTQSSAWARVKGPDGWRPLRVIVEQGGDIVAGAQLLHRPVGRLGGLGYLSRGPVAAEGDVDAATAILSGLRSATRAARVRAVLVEPPVRGAGAGLGREVGDLVPAAQRMSLGATVLLDITRSPDELLTRMRSATRANVRRSQRRGIQVRRAGPEAIPTFHDLLVRTGRRQGFHVAGRSHYRHWAEILGPAGYLQVFLAERDGVPVSAMLAIACGDTVVYKRGAWSGEHGDLRPNEALHWAAIRWAQEAGYRWYDLDGIDRAPAELALAQRPIPERYIDSVTRFKLGFGGEVVLLPEALVHLRGAASRRAYSHLGPRLAASPRARRLLTASS
jgi:peptidoglycan pentaglycine glycine transferase (the first glycine)